MSLNTAMGEKYRNNVLQEVAANVEQGDWVKMCMQCGVCAGSCPLGDAWEHSPQKLFMMIRANKREEVLTSESMWMCTSCYNCVVRCPRELPIKHIMHGLASYARKLGLAPKRNPTLWFSEVFWNNLMKHGRVNELKLSLSLYFKEGFGAGIQQTMAHQKLGMSMIKSRRLAPMNMFVGHGVKDISGLQKMIRKAQDIEAAQLEANSK